MDKYEKYELIAAEALLKRASLLKEPFMIKGSMITRQYIKKEERNIADMDWVYLERIEDADTASEIFSDWMIRITTMDYDDNVKFRDFRENQFWRYIDYAMSDDFPTVNTDIEFQIGESKYELSLDISFNLDMEKEPVQLLYKPLTGKSFLVPYTPPLSLQIAWKLHQTIVRPRYKDLYDLSYLLVHPSYNEDIFKETVQALFNEWKRDNFINPKQMKNLFYGALDNYHFYNQLKSEYSWNNYNANNEYSREEFSEFISSFCKILRKSGFNEKVYLSLPIPNNKRK